MNFERYLNCLWKRGEWMTLSWSGGIRGREGNRFVGSMDGFRWLGKWYYYLVWLDESVHFRRGNVFWFMGTSLVLWHSPGWSTVDIQIFARWHGRIFKVFLLMGWLCMREVLGIRSVEVKSNMVIHVFYGIGDWEFSGADCFMVVDCEVVAGAS